MKVFQIILILFCLITVGGCVNSSLKSVKNKQVKQNYQESDYVIMPFWKDTIPILPSTKYFYRYILNDFRERLVSIDWVFGNLHHFGIPVDEAWYYEGASHTDFGNGAMGKTIVPPSLVVGSMVPNYEILDHQFEPIEYFDPFAHPNGPQSKFTHYVRKQTNK